MLTTTLCLIFLGLHSISKEIFPPFPGHRSFPEWPGNDTLVFHAKAGEVRTQFIDKEILAATYSGFRMPEGFYKDPAPDSADAWYANVREILKPSYSFNGRKVPRKAFTNRALDSLAAWYDTWLGPWKKDAPAVEFCTDSPDEARWWVRMIDSSRSVDRKLLQGNETDKYFEFRAEDSSPRHRMVLLRIHKCRYIDRWKADPSTYYWWGKDFSGWFQGVFHVRPVTEGNVRELGEYLWTKENRGRMHSTKVVSSFSRERVEEIIHTMFVLRKSIEDIGWMRSIPPHRVDPMGQRELARVTLVRLDYHVEKKSGTINLDSRTLRTIMVRDNPPEVIPQPPGKRVATQAIR